MHLKSSHSVVRNGVIQAENLRVGSHGVLRSSVCVGLGEASGLQFSIHSLVCCLCFYLDSAAAGRNRLHSAQ